MKNHFIDYIQSISTKFAREATSEMGYRTEFEILLKTVFQSFNVESFIDHDAKAKEGNKPDFVILQESGVPILYIETKDIGKSLDKEEKSEQMSRYFGYANLILTDYLEFRFYRNGLLYEEPIKIGEYDLKSRIIKPVPEQYEHLAKTLLDFVKSHREPIRSAGHLSKIMGGKTQRIRDNIRSFLAIDSGNNNELVRVYQIIKKLLVHNLTVESFSDMYAQTLVYGLFVARYYDDSPKTFSRQEARDLVPKSNPLLRQFFDHIVGPDFDKRLEYIVDELCEVFLHANIKELMKQRFKNNLWGETEKEPDPVIHFYEDFLKEYDPQLRKRLGAFYTPLPVVNFIVNSVDYLLQEEFGLSAGLAESSKTEGDTHKVQILDPAVGTGTFISAIIRNIYKKIIKTGQEGRWPAYVRNDLLPRLHGFELMMTPYAIAHLKLSMAFRKTGFFYFNEKRLSIYLTNSLEGGDKQTDLFAEFGLVGSIAKESAEAAIIKNELPIMVVVGNPPYSISSSNKGKWILDLIKDYKKNLREKKINIDDDYIKFIRLAEHYIEKNQTGIVAMITNNSFIDGITHRQMRKHLLETFDDIYILDLHGNSKKKEKTPDGGKDENVFDIQQGVSISIFVRKAQEKKKLGNVHHAEIYGSRKEKFKILNGNSVPKIKWQKLDYKEPYYFFVPKDFEEEEEYKKGFKIDELFPISNSGVKTDRDVLFIDKEKDVLQKRIKKLLSGDYNVKFKNDFRVVNSSGYKLLERLEGKIFNEDYLQKIQYRPFDYQWIYYDPELISRPGIVATKHLIKNNDNMALLTSRSLPSNQIFNRVFVTRFMADIHSASDQTYTFPLYLYHGDETKTPNLKKEILEQIKKIVGKTSPKNIFDYIYAVLHSSKYREKYKEFLKINFPRVPYPKNRAAFKKLAVFGKKLRKLHLLESPKLERFITTYPIRGSNIVEKVSYSDNKVFINKDQYFGKVPETAWNFYIGGYQPAQKWLKDRKGLELTNADIEHYQKIIIALIETDQIMRKVDDIL